MFDGRINIAQMRSIWFAIQRNHGAKARQIEWQLHLTQTTIYRYLPTMDLVGLHLSEDDHGGLYVWQK